MNPKNKIKNKKKGKIGGFLEKIGENRNDSKK